MTDPYNVGRPPWERSTRAKRLPPGWAAIRKRILRRDPECKACGRRPSSEVDHVVRGDDHSDSNLRGICWPCHKAKSAREGAAASAYVRWEQIKARHRPPEPHPGGWDEGKAAGPKGRQ